MGKILSNTQIATIEGDMKYAKMELNDAIEHINTVISKFENESIVQTFFAAGNFGKQEEEALIKIKELINRELNNIADNLIPATQNFLNNQRSLNDGEV